MPTQNISLLTSIVTIVTISYCDFVDDLHYYSFCLLNICWVSHYGVLDKAKECQSNANLTPLLVNSHLFTSLVGNSLVVITLLM